MACKQRQRFTFKDGPRETLYLQSKKSQRNKWIYLKVVLSLSLRNLAGGKCENSILIMYSSNGGSESLQGKYRGAFSAYFSNEMHINLMC